MGAAKGLPTTINDIIKNITTRLGVLERGINPNTGLTSEVTKTHTINAGAEYTAGEVLIEWTDLNMVVNPKAIPVFEIYIDADDTPANLFPNGASLTTAKRNFDFKFYKDLVDLTANPYRNKFVYYLKNNDSSQHTYYLHIKFQYSATNSTVTVV